MYTKSVKAPFKPYTIVVETVADHNFLRGILESGDNVPKASSPGFSSLINNSLATEIGKYTPPEGS